MFSDYLFLHSFVYRLLEARGLDCVYSIKRFGSLIMEIKKIFGFVVPIGKESDSIDDSIIQGSEISSTNKLFLKLTELFNNSKNDCDINIRFVSKTGEKKNEVRDLIVNLCNEFSLDNCKPLVKSLIRLTDKKIKEGLLFFIYAFDDTDKKLLIARYPSEEAITVKQEKGKYIFEVINDVFLKNSRKYKAVYYQSTLDNFWSGYAVDKQINDDNVKEISDYWIKKFLQSDLLFNSLRGSEMLAKAVRLTIAETNNDQVKEELISATSLIKNVDSKSLTFKSFFDKLNLSEQTRDEVLLKIPNQDIYEITFKFSSDIFSKNCNYLYKYLDNGAIAIAPAVDFPTAWRETVTKNGKVRYSTEGKKIKTKVTNRV